MDPLIILALIKIIVVVALIGDGSLAPVAAPNGCAGRLRNCTAKLQASEQHYRCQSRSPERDADQVYRPPEGARWWWWIPSAAHEHRCTTRLSPSFRSYRGVLLAAQKAFRGQPLAAYGMCAW